MNHAELRLAFDKKVRSGIFNPVARLLAEDVREDRLQCHLPDLGDVRAVRRARRAAQRRHAGPSWRLRATDPSKHYVPADGPRKKDTPAHQVDRGMRGVTMVLS